MWKNSKEFSILKNKWKKSWKKEILDIFLFGSAIKGKSKPNDIDLCLVFKNQINLNLLREAEKLLGEKFHISSLLVKDFICQVHSLSRTILLEGVSILSGKKLAESYGLNPKIIYSYHLSGEEPSKKVRLVYLLRGRGGTRGLVEKMGGNFFSISAFMIPVDKDKEMQEILESWKVKYFRRTVLLMN